MRRTGWRSEGAEPDPRFTFANERTFLAWIRTALALVAGGVGVDAFAEELEGWERTTLAGALIAFGASVAVAAHGRWRRSEVALRQRRPLPPSGIPAVLGSGVGLVAAAVLALVVLT